jgi:prevent-host-death family protein
MGEPETIGTVEAKTRFSSMIAEVETGKDFIITRRGKPVAKIIPFPQMAPGEPRTRREAIEWLWAFGENARKQGKGMTRQEILDAIREGRP